DRAKLRRSARPVRPGKARSAPPALPSRPCSRAPANRLHRRTHPPPPAAPGQKPKAPADPQSPQPMPQPRTAGLDLPYSTPSFCSSRCFGRLFTGMACNAFLTQIVLLQVHRIGDVVLVDVADVLNGLTPHDLGCAVLDVAEPGVGVKAEFFRFVTELPQI